MMAVTAFAKLLSTYNFAHEHDVLTSYEEDAACDVTVSVADEHSLYCVLQDEVGYWTCTRCMKGLSEMVAKVA